MPTTGYVCTRRGEWHPELLSPITGRHLAPDAARDECSMLDEELCVVREEHFFIRGLVHIPLVDSNEHFEWGASVSLSADSFRRRLEL